MYRTEMRCIEGLGGSGESGGKEPIGRPRPRWEDNIKKLILKKCLGFTKWTCLAQDIGRVGGPL
jgi:hypothetical protein